MSTHDPKEYVTRLAGGDHAALFYDDIDRKDDILSVYIEHFASRQEEVLLVMPSKEEQRLRHALVKYGIDVADLEKRGILKLFPTEYAAKSIGGLPFDSKRDTWKSWLASHREKEPTRIVRLIVDDPLALFAPDDILRMEADLGKIVRPPATVLCVYHTPSVMAVSRAFYKELIRLHGHALFPGYATEIDPPSQA